MKRVVSLCMFVHFAGSIALAQGQSPQGPRGPAADVDPAALAGMVAELRGELAAQRALLAEHARELAEQRATIEVLRRQLADGPPPQAVLSAQAGQAAQPPPASTAPDHRPDPELPQQFVAAGEFPGSIGIPGTGAAFRIGGQARATFISSLTPLGEDDRFITSSIPVGADRPGEQTRTTFTAAPSRINLDLRSAEPFGGVRTFIEYDFSGSGTSARLRHAFIQGGRWIFGQTWSTFSDPEAKPTDIDFEGLNAISLFRQAQVRYTHPLRDRLSLSLAAENPAPDLTGATGVNVTPDFVTRVRWDPAVPASSTLTRVAHVQGAILLRTLRGGLADQPQTTLTTGAFGATVSGVLVPWWDRAGQVKFAAYGGRGIGRYIKDLEALGGQDAVYDSSTGRLRALGVSSGYIGYERQWRAWLHSGVTYGIVRVSNLDVQPDSALRRTQRASMNVAWLPVPHAELITEFLFGSRVDKNGARGRASQIQAGWKLTY